MKTARRFLSAFILFASIISCTAAEQLPPAHPVAPWIQSAVIYELNTRTFSPTGNFRGIESRLDALKDLGITVVWLMPIHPAGELNKKGSIGSPYAVRDYYAINPAYGTKDDLKHLVSEVHKRGMKIIIDIVANHTAWDSVLMKHPEFYKKDGQGKVIPPNPDWSDVAGLDYRNPQLRAYMTDMLKYWLREFDLDGFRCDVAGEVPTDFWENARVELERIKPDILMLAESNKPELLVKAFDLDYAWPFHSTLTGVFENGAPAPSIPDVLQRERERYPKGAIQMRFSDDHDEKRAIARFGERGALAASVLVFTLEGVPLLYNGMEVGDTTESFCPAQLEDFKVFWPVAERRPEFLPLYKGVIALRKAHPALQQGETKWLRNGDNDRILTYARRAGNEEFIVAINTSNRPYTGVADVAGEFEDVTPGSGVNPKATLPVLSLEAWGYRIYKRIR
jgi:glycosidase